MNQFAEENSFFFFTKQLSTVNPPIGTWAFIQRHFKFCDAYRNNSIKPSGMITIIIRLSFFKTRPSKEGLIQSKENTLQKDLRNAFEVQED